MGVNYNQFCIFGLAFALDDIKIIESPDEYKLENRYDVKTGKVTRQEKVLVKEEVYHYRINGFNFECPDSYCFKDYYTKFDSYNDMLYVGYEIGSFHDFGRVELLEGSVSLSELEEMSSKISKDFPEHKNQIMLHFFNMVG